MIRFPTYERMLSLMEKERFQISCLLSVIYLTTNVNGETIRNELGLLCALSSKQSFKLLFFLKTCSSEHSILANFYTEKKLKKSNNVLKLGLLY